MREPLIIHPHHGPLFGGRIPASPETIARRLPAADYVTASAPRAPGSMAASDLAQECVDRMLLNDKISNCTTATTMKCSAQVLGFAGVRIIYDNAEADAFYRLSTGNNPPATDDGGNEEDVIDYATAHGIEKGLHRWAGKMSVDGTNPEQVRQVLGKSKNLMFGSNLARDWLKARNGDVLGMCGGPDKDLGHAFPAGGRKGFFTPEGIVVTLWGGIEVLMPWNVVAVFTAPGSGGELHSMISRDAIVKGRNTTADGLNWDKYEEDFMALQKAA